MLNNYFTIKEVAKYIDGSISGFLITDIFTQEKNKLLIEVVNELKSDSKILEYSIEKGLNYLVIKNHYSKARKNVADLFSNALEKKISGVKLYNDDRAISIILDDDFEMIFTFFSNRANCFITERNLVINAFKDKEEYLHRYISEIIPIKTPSANMTSPDDSVEKYLKRIYREYGDLYSKEVLFSKQLSGKDLADAENISILKKGLDEINSKLKAPEYLLYSNDKSFRLSLTKLAHLFNFKQIKFDNVNDLISEFIKFKFRIDKTDLLRDKAIADLNQKILNIEKKIKGIHLQLEHCEDSESLRRSGNIILQNIHLITKGDKNFSLISDEGKALILKLKENLTPSENAAVYFEKYKKQKSSVDILKAKSINFKNEKTKLESEFERINNMTEYKTLLKEEKKSAEDKNDETLKFRKFKLNEKYEVWVGKDSVSNDMLTTKYASQNDLWFHVRGASGSHTVLKVNNKKEDVDKNIINKAASIAAYYSKARNASSVPVAYCEKKYVKKKKGFKQGSVIMEREKVIFVKPSLPGNVMSNE